jgi:isopentenyl-diphosphate delta-isomerase
MSNSKKDHQIMAQNQDVLMEVNSADQVIGQVGKVEAHQGKGILHRAITVVLINLQDEILIAKRSKDKPLWPEFWDFACSTHPWYPDETTLDCARRRIPFELGVEMDKIKPLEDVFTYEYHAVYNQEWSENEINHLVIGTYVGRSKLEKINPDEVLETRWVSKEELLKLSKKNDFFAPWVEYIIKFINEK